MAELDLIIFDDAVARAWYPFTLTRTARLVMKRRAVELSGGQRELLARLWQRTRNPQAEQ